VALARALVVGARLLLADEPTSQLDPASAAAVVEAIRGAHAAGCTVVVASHDPALLAIAGEVRRM
jgi:ABC-type lipoprotein export system ATPase subunit